MSVQTQIDRLEAAKEAIAAAIAGKGVTVPAGTMLDGMAALIESIEAGGGGELQYVSGRVVLQSAGSALSVSALNFKPKFIHIYKAASNNTTTKWLCDFTAFTGNTALHKYGTVYLSGSTSDRKAQYSVSAGSSEAGRLTITDDGFSCTLPYTQTGEYNYWVAG